MKRQKKKEIRNWLTGMAFLAPNLIGFIIFIVIPVLASLVLCFFNFDIAKGFSSLEWVGVGNFTKMLDDMWFTASLKNNLVFSLVTVPTSIVFALAIALVVNDKIFNKNAIRAAFFIPYITNITAICAVWMMLFQPSYGPINGFLTTIGVANPPGWLSSMNWSLSVIMFMHIWRFTGYNMVIYLAAIQNISKDVKEAAKIDGATGLQLLRYVSIPLLSPTTFLLTIIGIIDSFKVFGPVSIMTQGGPGTSTSVLVYYIYSSAFKNGNMGYAASISWVLFIIIFAITIIQWQGQKKWVDFN